MRLEPEEIVAIKAAARFAFGDTETTQHLREFDLMPSYRRSASRAVLKRFEQIEDQISRAFRAIPKMMGEDTKRWFARDYADYMIDLPGKLL